MLDYVLTNESVKAIIAGLSPQKGDRILAVAGSGDQALALLSEGAKVFVIDVEQNQLDYFRKRVDNLRVGDYSIFRDFYEGSPNGRTNLDFFADVTRRERIRSNLSNLEILKANSVFDEGIDLSEFNKFYLSNVPSFNNSSPPRELVRGLSRRMIMGSLIYISASFRIPFWWLGLRVDKERTRLALSLEGNWNPFVLYKLF